MQIRKWSLLDAQSHVLVGVILIGVEAVLTLADDPLSQLEEIVLPRCLCHLAYKRIAGGHGPGSRVQSGSDL